MTGVEEIQGGEVQDGEIQDAESAVPPAPRAPALCRRRLRTELRLLREGAGLTGRQVAEAMGWSVAKVSRLERAEGTLRDAEVRAVCALYHVPGDRAAVL